MTAHDVDRTEKQAEELLAELAQPQIARSRRIRLREDLAVMHLPLAGQIARRYRRRGEPFDDLLQVARLGLMKAIRNFDAALGHRFRGYAAVTISGEIKRYFRDHTWAVKVPGPHQDRGRRLHRLIAELSQAHGRTPTVDDLAAAMGITPQEVELGLDAARAYSTVSLDAPIGAGDERRPWADFLADDDRPIRALLDRHTLKPLINALPARDRTILLLRFYRDLTQAEIAAEVGISTMHVSRILRAVLGRLRSALA